MKNNHKKDKLYIGDVLIIIVICISLFVVFFDLCKNNSDQNDDVLINKNDFESFVANTTEKTENTKVFSETIIYSGSDYNAQKTESPNTEAVAEVITTSPVTTTEVPKIEIITTDITTNFAHTTTETQTVTTNPVLNEPKPEDVYISLGKFRLTAYCPCKKCCGKWAENRPLDKNGNEIILTASGKYAKQGFTIAADTSVLPFGTRIYINGHEYEVQDVGGAVKGNSIDIYFDNHEDALNFGLQYEEVMIKK